MKKILSLVILLFLCFTMYVPSINAFNTTFDDRYPIVDYSADKNDFKMRNGVCSAYDTHIALYYAKDNATSNVNLSTSFGGGFLYNHSNTSIKVKDVRILSAHNDRAYNNWAGYNKSAFEYSFTKLYYDQKKSLGVSSIGFISDDYKSQSYRDVAMEAIFNSQKAPADKYGYTDTLIMKKEAAGWAVAKLGNSSTSNVMFSTRPSTEVYDATRFIYFPVWLMLEVVVDDSHCGVTAPVDNNSNNNNSSNNNNNSSTITAGSNNQTTTDPNTDIKNNTGNSSSIDQTKSFLIKNQEYIDIYEQGNGTYSYVNDVCYVADSLLHISRKKESENNLNFQLTFTNNEYEEMYIRTATNDVKINKYSDVNYDLFGRMFYGCGDHNPEWPCTSEMKLAAADGVMNTQRAKNEEYTPIGTLSLYKTNNSEWTLTNEKIAYKFLNITRPIKSDSKDSVFFPIQVEYLAVVDESNCIKAGLTNKEIEEEVEEVEVVEKDKVENTNSCTSTVNISGSSTKTDVYKNGGGLDINDSNLTARSYNHASWRFTTPTLNKETNKCEFTGVYVSYGISDYVQFDNEPNRRLYLNGIDNGISMVNNQFSSSFTSNDRNSAAGSYSSKYGATLDATFPIQYNGISTTAVISNKNEIKMVGYSNEFKADEFNNNVLIKSLTANTGFEKITGNDVYSYSMSSSSFKVNEVTFDYNETKSGFLVNTKRTWNANTYLGNNSKNSFCNGGYNRGDDYFRNLLSHVYKKDITCRNGTGYNCDKKVSTLFAPVKVQFQFSLSDTTACEGVKDDACTIEGNFGSSFKKTGGLINAYSELKLNDPTLIGKIKNEDGSLNPRFAFTEPKVNEVTNKCEFKMIYISSSSHELLLYNDGSEKLTIGSETIDISSGKFAKNIEYKHLNTKDFENPLLPKEFDLSVNGQIRKVKIPDLNSVFIVGYTNNISQSEMQGSKFFESFKIPGNYTNLTPTSWYSNSMHPGSYTADAIITSDGDGYYINVDRTFLSGSAIASTNGKGFCEGAYNGGDEYFKTWHSILSEGNQISNVVSDKTISCDANDIVCNKKLSVIFDPVKIEIMVQLDANNPACSNACTTEGIYPSGNSSSGTYSNGTGINYDDNRLVGTLEDSNRYTFTEPKLDDDGFCVIEGVYLSSTTHDLYVDDDGVRRLGIGDVVDGAERDIDMTNNWFGPSNITQTQDVNYTHLPAASLPEEFKIVFKDNSTRTVKIKNPNEIEVLGWTNGINKGEFTTNLVNNFAIQSPYASTGENLYKYSIHPGSYDVNVGQVIVNQSSNGKLYGIPVNRTWKGGQSVVNPESELFCGFGDLDCNVCINGNSANEVYSNLYAPVKVQFKLTLEDTSACQKAVSVCNKHLDTYIESGYNDIFTQELVELDGCCDSSIVSPEELEKYINEGMCPQTVTPEIPIVCEGSKNIECCDDLGDFNGTSQECIIDRCSFLHEKLVNTTTTLTQADKDYITNNCCVIEGPAGEEGRELFGDACPVVPKCDNDEIAIMSEDGTYKCVESCILDATCTNLNFDEIGITPEQVLYKDIDVVCDQVIDTTTLEPKSNSPLSYESSSYEYFYPSPVYQNNLCEINCSIKLVATISKDSNVVVAGQLLPFSYSPATITPTYTCIQKMKEELYASEAYAEIYLDENNELLETPKRGKEPHTNIERSILNLNYLSLKAVQDKITAASSQDCSSLASVDYNSDYENNSEYIDCIKGLENLEKLNKELKPYWEDFCPDGIETEEKRDKCRAKTESFFLTYDQYKEQLDTCQNWVQELDLSIDSYVVTYEETTKGETLSKQYTYQAPESLGTHVSEAILTSVDDNKNVPHRTLYNYYKNTSVPSTQYSILSINKLWIDGFRVRDWYLFKEKTTNTLYNIWTREIRTDIILDLMSKDENKKAEDYFAYTYPFDYYVSRIDYGVISGEVYDALPNNIDKEAIYKKIGNKYLTSRDSDILLQGNNIDIIISNITNKSVEYKDERVSPDVYCLSNIEMEEEVSEGTEMNVKFAKYLYEPTLKSLGATIDNYSGEAFYRGEISPLNDPTNIMYSKVIYKKGYIDENKKCIIGNQQDKQYKNELKINLKIDDCKYYLGDATCFPYCDIPGIADPILEVDNELVVANWPNGSGDNFTTLDNSKEPNGGSGSTAADLLNFTARQVDISKPFSKDSVSSNWVNYTSNVNTDIFRKDVYPKNDSEKEAKALYIITLDSDTKELILDYNKKVGNNYVDFENFTFNKDGVSGTSNLLNKIPGNNINIITSNIENKTTGIRRYNAFGDSYDSITGKNGFNELLIKNIREGN